MAAAEKKLSSDDILSRLDELPTLPTIVYELSQLINDPMSSTAEIEKLMSTDQSLTTKVLRLVNSAYYAIPGGVSTLGRAIAYLGYDTVNQLVLSASILQALDKKGPSLFDFNEFWKHSLGVAVTAETIGRFVRHPVPSDMFTCGLVHDVGKVALYTLDNATMLEVVNKAMAENKSYHDAENELDVIRHTSIGHKLAQKWKLPMQIQSVIKYHHQKDAALRGGLSADLNRTVDVVYMANLLTHALKFGNSGHNKIIGAPKDLMERLSIHPDGDFKKLLVEVKDALDRAADLMRALGAG